MIAILRRSTEKLSKCDALYQDVTLTQRVNVKFKSLQADFQSVAQPLDLLVLGESTSPSSIPAISLIPAGKRGSNSFNLKRYKSRTETWKYCWKVSFTKAMTSSLRTLLL